MHWSDRYLGRPYIPGEFDCAALAMCVQWEVFGRTVRIPAEHATGIRAQSAQININAAVVADPIDKPSEGDAVLMKARGLLSHVGVYCVINGEPHVLHAMRNAGQVVRHRLRDLKLQGLTVEGFYAWR